MVMTPASILAVRLRLLGRLEAGSDRLLDGVWGAITALGPYGALGPVDGADVFTGAVRWMFATFVACLREGRSLHAGERVYLRGLGAQRAAQGFPLEVVERGFFLAFERCIQELTRLAREDGDLLALEVLVDLVNELGPLSRAAWRAIEEGYEAVGHGANGVGMPDRMDAVKAILDGAGEARHVAALGWGRSDRCVLVAVVAVARQLDGDLARLVESLAGELPKGAAGPVWTTPVRHGAVLACWPAAASEEPGSALGPVAERLGVLLVVSAPTTVGAVGEVFGWLRHDLDVACSLQPGTGALAVEAVARQVGAARPSAVRSGWFARRYLGPVLAEKPWLAAPLMDTLAVLEEPGVSVAVAAERLGMSEGGVRDRLERIAELTGLRYRIPGDARLLLDAHEQWRRHRDELPPLGDAAWIAPT